MEITTPRLLLRDDAADELPAVRAYGAEPRAREFYGPGEGRPDQVRALLATFPTWAAAAPRENYQLAVARRAAPAEVIGAAGLRRTGLPAGEAELGLELAPARWCRGYAAEAARAMLAHGFTAWGLTAVRGETVSTNARVTRARWAAGSAARPSRRRRLRTGAARARRRARPRSHGEGGRE